jgi:hypothetical protein
MVNGFGVCCVYIFFIATIERMDEAVVKAAIIIVS